MVSLLVVLLALFLGSQAQLQLGGVRPGPAEVLNQRLPADALYANNNLFGQCVCVLGRFAVLTGGRVLAFQSATDKINVFNLETEQWVTGQTAVLPQRRRAHGCATVTVGNASTCVVVGGQDETTPDTQTGTVGAAVVNTHYITVSDAGVASIAAGPTAFVATTVAVRNLACAGVGSVIYCLGGEAKSADAAADHWLPRKQSFWLDRAAGTPTWTLGAVPTSTATGVYFPDNSPAVVDGLSRVWFCGGVLWTDGLNGGANANQVDANERTPNTVCWVWDTTNSTFNASTASLPTVTLTNARARAFATYTAGPNPRVVVLGGGGNLPAAGTGELFSILPIVADQLFLVAPNLTTSSQTLAQTPDFPLWTQNDPTTPAFVRHWDLGGRGAASVYTGAVFFGGRNCFVATCDEATTERLDFATVLDLYNPASPTRWLLKLSNAFRFGVAASWSNKAFLLTGSAGADTVLPYVHVVRFSCTGTSAAGDDTWHAASGTCRVQECNDNYYGASCTACNCTATGNVTTGVCDGGLTGTGACTCNTGYYGTACHSGNGEVCTGNGVIDPSVNSTGSCTCFPGFWGEDCAGTCDTCTNGVCNDGANGDGVCECLPGFYGDACTACDCGTGACHAGLTGTGECVCEPGTWGANCQGVCGVPTEEATEFDADGCPPVALDEEFVLTFRCDDGAAGTGHCVPLYSSAVVSVQSLVILLLSCLALLY